MRHQNERRGRGALVRARGLAALLAVAGIGAACEVPTALPRFENTIALPADTLTVPVLGAPATSPPVSVDFVDVDEAWADRVRDSEFELTPSRTGVSGDLTIRLRELTSGAEFTATVTLDGSAEPVAIEVPGATMRAFVGRQVEVVATGDLGPADLTNPLDLAVLVKLRFEIGGES